MTGSEKDLRGIFGDPTGVVEEVRNEPRGLELLRVVEVGKTTQRTEGSIGNREDCEEGYESKEEKVSCQVQLDTT